MVEQEIEIDVSLSLGHSRGAFQERIQAENYQSLLLGVNACKVSERERLPRMNKRKKARNRKLSP